MAEQDSDLAYDGSAAPQRRELTAREVAADLGMAWRGCDIDPQWAEICDQDVCACGKRRAA